MKGDKAQTRPARRTPPLRETHEGRQMKGDKAQTRPARRTPPLRETHEGRQMKGDKTQTRPERRTPPVTKRRTHLKKELRTPDSKLFGEKNALRISPAIKLALWEIPALNGRS